MTADSGRGLRNTPYVPSLLDSPALDLRVAAARLEGLRSRAASSCGWLRCWRLAAASSRSLASPIMGFHCCSAPRPRSHSRPWPAPTGTVCCSRWLRRATPNRSSRSLSPAEHLRTLGERDRLANWLRSVVGRTGSQLMVDRARTAAFADRLLALAELLTDPAVRFSAQGLALCRRLVCEPMRSPLYNPNIPEVELLTCTRSCRAGSHVALTR